MLDAPIPTESECVEAWRLAQLLDVGYPVPLAEQIARRADGADQVDLHRAVELVRAGCPHRLAADILL